MEAIDPCKDVDGLTSRNAGLLYESAFGGADPKNVPKGIHPATAKGVIALLKENKIPMLGKRALVIGRSLLVGKPVAMLLLREQATVTIAHSKTKNLSEICLQNDIIIVAVGKANLLGKKAFKRGHVIVDVGTNALKGPKTLEEITKRKLVGDVNFKEAVKVVKAISPVPGGVGPMTVASLFENLLEATKTIL
jgi:methylenetetrahydrofolate dehydrogenase (NADP+)/methenyltetrahydrofolate cyclohydrolase